LRGGKKNNRDDPPEGDAANKGGVIYDATECPQDIAYRTDLGLLNRSREITEELIDVLHGKQPLGKKPRTYRKTARKACLRVAQNRNPSKKTIRKGIKSQLQYLRRNFKTVERMLDGFGVLPLDHRLQRRYWIIRTVYLQKLKMFKSRSHQVGYRIVSIHEPNARPIVPGESRARTGFGAKINLSLVDGYSYFGTRYHGMRSTKAAVPPDRCKRTGRGSAVSAGFWSSSMLLKSVALWIFFSM
jgi:IS5 family transposase